MRFFAVRPSFLALLLMACSADETHVGNGGDCPGSRLKCDADPSHADDESEQDADDPGDGDGDGDEDPWQEERDAGPPPVGDACKPEDIVPEGCIAATSSESTAGLCDGLDNDCDGDVDEGCICVPGTVQRCFAGPPARRNVGGCEAGTQRCEGVEFGKWGECSGGRLPQAEVCDALDNDCNGCVDEIAGCDPDLACPAPGDPRVPDGAPFSTYPLRGADFVNVASVATWEWTVTGTPCDTMFLAIPGSTASATNGQLSFVLRNADQPDASIQFTLSGDYTVTMKVTLNNGSVIECSWIVHVRAAGVRVELCWDNTGPTSVASNTTIDVDLHLGKHGITSAWFDTMDCHYSNCGPYDTDHPAWGYVASPIAACSGAGTGAVSCPNPRLDIDNVSRTERYVPENINVDNPRDGDEFRVMIHHFSDVASTREPFDSHPLVNVYCGGELKGTFGAAPDRIAGFRDGGGDYRGDMWRVVDITPDVDAAGVTTSCDLAPLSAPGVPGAPWVTTDDYTF